MGDQPDEIRLKPTKDGSFIRPDSAFRSFVSKDPDSQFPAEKHRYVLYLSPGCPWSHRAMIVRSLKKLEDIIDLYICSLTMGKDGWFFDDSPEAANDIIRMLYTKFDHLLPDEDREINRPGGGFYPHDLREKIDEINEWVYDSVNNGVYKTGFATSQAAYEENVVNVFKSLDRLERILDEGPCLLGKNITEADIRLFPTILRFDVGYVPIFMCNLGTIKDHYPNLHLWLRRLYWDNGFRTRGAFRKTSETWLEKYKTGYANARRRVLGITGPDIVPKGPLVLIHELEEGERL
ncbi:hypothetical protein H9Q69_002516 [Fusarium xylarioides]|nr:hypothetical protein H9Q69_002516 [Fusarium xylarioides]